VGRHGGRSDERNAGSGHGVDSVTSSITAAAGTVLAPEREGLTVVPAPLGGNRAAAASQAPESPPVGLALGGRTSARWWEDGRAGAGGSSHPWWDDAPVPPPVVVASADGRTPAVTFAPDADPFSAGGVFAHQGGRDGEPLVVVYPAPDAAVLRSAKRGRAPGAGTGAFVDVLGTRNSHGQDSGPDTGSLVRPYVAQAEASERGDDAAVPDPPSVRRGRRSGSPLDRIIDAAPAAPRPVAGEWSAPWTGDGPGVAEEGPATSLFEPAQQSGETSPWTGPREQPLPSRKALRAKERAVASTGDGTGGEPGSRNTGRRIAKSGVLAVTAVGVVAASAPNAFPALGWRLPSHPVNRGAPAALLGYAGGGALPAPDVSLSSPAGASLLAVAPRLSAERPDNAAAAARLNAAEAARQSAIAAARAGAVASGAGRTLVDVAREQVRAEAARKAAIAQQVSRNVVRDPRAYARLLLQERGWGDQFSCLNLLWDRESGWNYQAYNPSSGAYGIPQALPGSKMASIASDWRTNPATQIRWGLNYIAERYGTPCGAWSHSQATGWY
jgi:hypothetical protein